MRYTVDRISDSEWQIFDGETKQQSLTYLLFASSISNSGRNVQFTLTVYDAINTNTVFERELWSSSFYLADATQYESLAEQITDSLEGVDVENPIELAYMFGGLVRSQAVQMPPLPHTH